MAKTLDKNSLEDQAYNVGPITIHQDNASTMLLEKSARALPSKSTIAFRGELFYKFRKAIMGLPD